MPVADLPEDEEIARAAAAVDAWIAAELAGDGDAGGVLLAGEPQPVTDRTASHRWYLRFAGEEKEAITLWLTLRQRTLHHEAQFMPAPESNAEETFAYLLRSNAELFAMSFCLGPEDAVYLVGRVPAAYVDKEELDRIVGSSLLYVDEHFPTAMSMAHPWYRRRRPRRPSPDR